MAGPSEILIVLGVFGLVGCYLTIVHRFLGSDVRETARLEEGEELHTGPMLGATATA